MLDGKAGQHIRVGVIGGSISKGVGASDKKRTDYFNLFCNWLSPLSEASITCRNGAVRASTASFMEICMENSLDSTVDLVLVEFCLNNAALDNGHTVYNPVVRDMERLLRRVLSMRSKPAVIMVKVPTPGIQDFPAPESRLYTNTTEDLEGALSSYYDVPTVSLRNSAYQLMDRGKGFTWYSTFMNRHPGDAGHRMLGDLLVGLMQDTALGLALEPIDEAEDAAWREALPQPIHPGNTAPLKTLCVRSEKLPKYVVRADGWEYVDEGDEDNPKPGFVATEPGSVLELELGTQGFSLDRSKQLALILLYLTSYDIMGTAEIKCVSGCKCEPRIIDSVNSRRESQTALAELLVPQSDRCRVAVTVLQETTSNGHKFKVSGLVVKEARPWMAGDHRLSYALDRINR
ncbi:hypothetical protein HYH03_009688 [Edaphochlamys debaryana]|uniref:SGNH hydrolase-type esterase domain-containing protein n=1 Tax=Edaphochlamys debaryana TaxID=47281 RepID=A0A835XXE3_9CHLO|nr:hypothetical protein HYH03_009688 [Edaphochlamys debaryana]|eukprot:KAG2491956.1 hypothetical protein HYH03_009688 [Edaphochlamys debaryana]